MSKGLDGDLSTAKSKLLHLDWNRDDAEEQAMKVKPSTETLRKYGCPPELGLSNTRPPRKLALNRSKGSPSSLHRKDRPAITSESKVAREAKTALHKPPRPTTTTLVNSTAVPDLIQNADRAFRTLRSFDTKVAGRRRKYLYAFLADAFPLAVALRAHPEPRDRYLRDRGVNPEDGRTTRNLFYAVLRATAGEVEADFASTLSNWATVLRVLEEIGTEPTAPAVLQALNDCGISHFLELGRRLSEAPEEKAERHRRDLHEARERLARAEAECGTGLARIPHCSDISKVRGGRRVLLLGRIEDDDTLTILKVITADEREVARQCEKHSIGGA
jgi:hypothetical protein